MKGFTVKCPQVQLVHGARLPYTSDKVCYSFLRPFPPAGNNPWPGHCEYITVCHLLNLRAPYQSLDHEHSLGPHIAEELVDVNRVLHLQPLQHAVQEDEGPGPTHTRTAVDQEGEAIVLVVPSLDAPDEGDERGGKLGHSVVRPGGEVVVHNPQ